MQTHPGTSQHGAVVQLYLAAVSVTIGAAGVVGVVGVVVINALSVIPSPAPVLPVKFAVTGPEAKVGGGGGVTPGLQAGPPLQVPDIVPVIVSVEEG